MDLQAFRQEFTPLLERAAQEHLALFHHTAQDPFLAASVSHVTQLITGGKRLRPYLAFLGYQAGSGGDTALALRLGIGLELFHVFCLIHDDIIDKADLRRGVATVEAFIKAQLQAQGRRGDAAHLAKSSTLLIGDLVCSWAHQQLSSVALASAQPAAVLAEYHGMVDEVVVGQMIDVDTMTRDEHSTELLERKMYLKTAGYSFVRPLRIGVQASGQASPELLAAMTAIGTPMGLAFQIQDDVLDITSTPEVLGKPTLSDLCEGQQTLLTAFVAKQGSAEERALLHRVMCGQSAEGEVAQLRNVLLTGGAVAQAQERSAALWAEARQAVHDAPLADDMKATFQGLINLLANRSR